MKAKTTKSKQLGHTPGPWKAEHSGYGDATVCGARVENCPAPFTPIIVSRTSWGNALLIAAAPDLLAACRQILWKLGHGADETPNTIDRRDAVILMAKRAVERAEGK